MSEQQIIANELMTAHSSEGVVDLPCGFLDKDGNLHTTAHIREISGVEEDMLASDKIKPFEKISRLLGSCVVRVGPVSGRDVHDVVRRMTFGDRLWLLLKIRQLTLGDIFPFTQRCVNANCRKTEVYRIRLSDLEFVPMEDRMKRVYEVELPRTKQTAVFHVMTGVDEEAISPYTDNIVSRGLHIRLEKLGSRQPGLREVQELGSMDRDALRARIAEVEGGVDTEITLTCPHCGNEWSLDLDITQQGFFFPSRVQNPSKKKSSS